MRRSLPAFVYLLVAAIAIMACGGTPTTVPTAQGQAPTVQIGSAALGPDRTMSVCAGQTVALTTKASGTDLTYAWSVDGSGQLQRPEAEKGDTGSSNRYAAPPTAGEEVVKVTVTDDQGRSSTDQIIIVVAECQAPVPPQPVVTDTVTPASLTPSVPPACECATSGDCNALAWQAWADADLETALACAQRTLRGTWIAEADRQQQARQGGDICDDTPDPKACRGTPQPPCTEYWEQNWAVNDVAVGWFIRANVLCAQGQVADGRAAYQEIIDKYSCAWAWDPGGGWWRVADAALDEIDLCP